MNCTSVVSSGCGGSETQCSLALFTRLNLLILVLPRFGAGSAIEQEDAALLELLHESLGLRLRNRGAAPRLADPALLLDRLIRHILRTVQDDVALARVVVR